MNGILLWLLQKVVVALLADLEPKVGTFLAGIIQDIIDFINGQATASQTKASVQSRLDAFQPAGLKED